MADGPAIGTAYLRVAGDFSQVNAQAVGLFKSSKWSGLGKVAGVALAGGLVAGGALKALYDIGQQFDDVSDKIRTQTGATGKELGTLEKSFRNVVRKVPADFDTASSAVAGLAQRLDLTGRPLTRLSRQMTELSRITGTDIESNVTSITRLFGDWSIKTGEQTETLDKLFRASQETGVEIDALSSLMVQFGSPLRQLGLDFDTAAAMFSRFEKEGVNIQTLMPGLRMALKNFSMPTEELSATLKKVGVDIKDGPSVALADLMTAIEKAPTDLKANALAFQVFGARAGPDMAAAVREGRFELDELMATIAGGDDTIRKAGRQTMDFSEHWLKFKNNVLLELEPIATRVFDTLGDAMKDITKIMSDPKLSGGEKFDAFLNLISDAISDAVPKLVELGGKAAGALLKGFLDAGVWGHLAVGGLIYKMLGGLTAFSTAATAAGSTFAQRLGTGLKMGLARTGIGAAVVAALEATLTSGGVLDTLKGEGATWGRDFATSIAETFGPKLEKAIQNRSLPALRKINAAIGAYTDKWGEMFGELPPELTALADKSERAFQRTELAMERVKDKIHDLSVTWHGGMRSINRDTEQNMRAIERSFGTHSQRGKQLLSDNFDAAIDAIRNSMDAGKIATERGQRMIQDILGKQLKLFGIKTSDLFDSRTRSTSGDSMPKGGSWTHQRGGLVQFGRPGDVGPDNIFTRIGTKDVAVAPGEVAAVFNRHQLPVVNQRLADMGGLAGFFQRFKRPHALQSGGLVQALGPYDIPPIQFDPSHAGTNSHLHISMASVAIAQAIAKQMRAMGWGISETPWAGGLTVRHSDPGHYTGSAFDANTGADETRAEVAAIARLLSGQGGGAMVVRPGAQIKLPVFDHKGFPFSGVVAGGLNRSSRLIEEKANSLLSRLAVREGAEQGVGFGNIDTSGSDAALMRRISAQKGWNFNDWWALDAAETTHGANLTNPDSTARLRGQFLDMNWGKYGPGSDPAAHPSMAEQIISMGRYIAERYRNPTAAWAFHQAHNYYKRGGIVPMLQGGGLLKLAKGGIAKLFPQLGAKKGPRRHKALGQILDKVKGLGLDPASFEQLNALTNDSGIFQEFADRASQLTIEPFDETGEAILGKVNGLSEVEWLNKALETVFGLRNSLIGAESKVAKRMTQVGEMIGVAKERVQKLFKLLRDTNTAIEDNERRQRQIVKEIEQARAKLEAELGRPQSQRSQGVIDHQRSRIERLRGDLAQLGEKKAGLLGVQTRASLEWGTLKEKVIPEMTTKRTDLVTLRGDVLGSGGEGFDGLASVQGAVWGDLANKQLPVLPEFGVLGGTIFDLQSRLRELNAPKERITDSGDSTTEGPSAFSISDLLSFAEAVRYGAFDTERFAGFFARGGSIPWGKWGVAGETGRPELIEGPARVHSPAATQSMLGQAPPVIYADLYVGNEKIASMVRAEIRESDRAKRATYGAGVR